MATAPLFMVRDLGLPFLKKSADDANMLALAKILNHYKHHPDLLHECVRLEIEKKL